VIRAEAHRLYKVELAAARYHSRMYLEKADGKRRGESDASEMRTRLMERALSERDLAREAHAKPLLEKQKADRACAPERAL
jgi:hypothetical protein